MDGAQREVLIGVSRARKGLREEVKTQLRIDLQGGWRREWDGLGVWG